MAPATHVPDQNTLLAMQRCFMAAGRTLTAWIPTSISKAGFGFTLGKLFQDLAEDNVLIKCAAGRIWTPLGVGMGLISPGTFSLAFAVFDPRRDLKLLPASGLESRFSLPLAVASVFQILGVMAQLALVASF
jgi:uncharacterized membrane protein YidH (DUF202 family)